MNRRKNHFRRPPCFIINNEAVKLFLADFVFHHPTKMQQRRGVWHLFLQKIGAHKLTESIVVVNGVHSAFIQQNEPALQQIHPQHFFDSLRRTDTLAAEIMQFDEVDTLIPRDDLTS